MLELITNALSTHSLLATVTGALVSGLIQNCFHPVVRVVIPCAMCAATLVLLRFSGDMLPEDNILGHYITFVGVYLVVAAIPYFIRGTPPSFDKL